MNITWCETRPNRVMKSDVSITLAGDKRRLIIRISAGAMATKMKNAERICVGFDERNTVLAFAPGTSSGFKVTRSNNKSATILLSVSRVEGHIKPHELPGDYYFKKDEESGIYYIPIGALCHR